MSVKERGVTQLEVKLSVPDAASAEAIAGKWKEKNTGIYQYLIENLFDCSIIHVTHCINTDRDGWNLINSGETEAAHKVLLPFSDQVINSPWFRSRFFTGFLNF